MGVVALVEVGEFVCFCFDSDVGTKGSLVAGEVVDVDALLEERVSLLGVI